jgi:hypothetical protein
LVEKEVFTEEPKEVLTTVQKKVITVVLKEVLTLPLKKVLLCAEWPYVPKRVKIQADRTPRPLFST